MQAPCQIRNKIMEIEFGCEIRNIYLIPDEDCTFDDGFIYKEIIIRTNQFIILTPDEEYDEIQVSIKDNISEEFINIAHRCEGYTNRKLIGLWKCENPLGCIDQIIIGVDLFHPSLSFLCELGRIGVYKLDQLLSCNFIKPIKE